MYCQNCGATIMPGESFCTKCGTRAQNSNSISCPHCGTPNHISNICCSRCGSKLNSNTQQKPVNGLIIALSILASICVIAVILILLWDKIFPDSARTPEPTALPVVTTIVVTEKPTRPPNPTPYGEPEPTPVPTAPPPPPKAPYVSYSTYTDYTYSFSCPYPNGFYYISPLSDFTRRSLASHDDSGKIYICATTNSNGLSVNKVADNFKSTYRHTSVIFDERTSYYCSTLISDGYTYNYCYYNLSGGMIRGFEMGFNADAYTRYMDYASYMRSNISLF